MWPKLTRSYASGKFDVVYRLLFTLASELEGSQIQVPDTLLANWPIIDFLGGYSSKEEASLSYNSNHNVFFRLIRVDVGD